MIFDAIKEELKKIVSEIEYERFIKNIEFVEKKSKSDLIVIETINPYIASWVQAKYGERIINLFEQYTGVKAKLQISQKSKNKTSKNQVDLTKENKTTKGTLLNPSYTFDSFVVGGSNQFAFTVAKSVSENPGKAYNPLFIYGGVGLGKTHLLQAIGNELASKGKVVFYCTTEQFTNDFLHQLAFKTMDRFREKYRSVDLLIIDDIQFLSGKESTQEEFFYTFNELHSAGKQIVMTADKNPKQIAGLEDRLKSRFIWGQVADIQPPELETKIAIIKKKCEIDQIYLEDEIINYIATNIDENIRAIEGTLIKLNGYSKMLYQNITMDLVKDVLKEYIKEKRENITIDEIIKIVAKEQNCKPSEIRSKSRVASIVNARRMVIYLTRKLTPNSMPIIAEYFNMKDHTAVSHAMKKISEMINNDANFKLKIDELLNKISSPA